MGSLWMYEEKEFEHDGRRLFVHSFTHRMSPIFLGSQPGQNPIFSVRTLLRGQLVSILRILEA